MNRVAITGAGVVSPLGCTLADFNASLAAGRSGIDRLDPAVSAVCTVEVGGAVNHWDPAPWLSAAEAGNLDRATQFAIAAASQAVESSRLPLDAIDHDRAGVYWGTGMGGANTLEAGYRQLYANNSIRVRPLTVVMGMNNAAGSNLAVRYALRGPFANFSTACSSSAMSIGEAMRTIAAGRADVILAGGSEALLTAGMLAAWQAMRTLAPLDRERPDASCKPFDKRRLGLVLGEGAAAFVLESEAHARARGARVLAYVAGYGNCCDAVHMSRPDATGQARAMREALGEAGLAPSDIGYVNAHGTATSVGDVVEADAIKSVFADHDVPVSSTKSLHGHLLGGAGALELAAALSAFEDGVLPPTASLEQPDPACALDHVAVTARRVARPCAVMSNSFAFGGSNVVLVATRD